MGFNTQNPSQLNYRNLNPSYNQVGQQGTLSFWMKIPSTTNDIGVKDQIIFQKGSQEQVIKLDFHSSLEHYKFKIPLLKSEKTNDNKILFEVSDDLKKFRVQYKDLIKNLENPKFIYMVFIQAPNIVFKIENFDMEQMVLQATVEKVIKLPPNSHQEEYNDYMSFIKSNMFGEDKKYHNIALFNVDPSKASIPNDQGYYSLNYTFLDKQPLIRFGKTKGDLIMEVDTKKHNGLKLELINSNDSSEQILSEQLSRKMQDGQWHLYTIVYNDNFSQNSKFPSLRTGGDIKFYFDGKIYKQFNEELVGDYFRHNTGGFYLFPQEQQLQYREIAGLPKGAIAISEDKLLLNNLSQTYHVEFSNLTYWNYAISNETIKKIFNKGHDPKSFDEYQKQQLRHVYGEVLNQDRMIPIKAYTS